MKKPVEVVMIEDNPGDVVLVREAVENTGLPYRIAVVQDGGEAVEFLRQTGRHAGAIRPDLIVLDLKLPRRSGREVLADIRETPSLQGIPLITLSSSRSELDLVRLHLLPTQTAMEKPSTFDDYVLLVQAIEAFRLSATRHGKNASTEKLQ